MEWINMYYAKNQLGLVFKPRDPAVLWALCIHSYLVFSYADLFAGVLWLLRNEDGAKSDAMTNVIAHMVLKNAQGDKGRIQKI